MLEYSYPTILYEIFFFVSENEYEVTVQIKSKLWQICLFIQLLGFYTVPYINKYTPTKFL